jgi:tripartite-type tricarboxylate transporter receptor subunit TctC
MELRTSKKVARNSAPIPEKKKATMLRIFLGLIVAAGLALGAKTAFAEVYPDRPIRFMQGFAPTGNADVITRVLGQALSPSLGQQIVSESRSGAGGNLASAVTAKAPADGYTIVLLTPAHVILAAIYKSLEFDPVNDFEFISTVSDFPFFIVTNADSPYETIGNAAWYEQEPTRFVGFNL